MHSENITTVTQYMDVDDFPRENNGCDSEEQCGMEVWPCRVSDNPHIVSLKWQYPVRNMIYTALGIACTLLFGISALWHHFRAQPEAEAEAGEEECENGFSIPFFGTLQNAASLIRVSSPNKDRS